MFSLRSSCDPTPNSLTRSLERLRGEGRPVLDLTESNPTRAHLPYDEFAIRRALSGPSVLRYDPQPFGAAAAREAVARHLSTEQAPLDASRVVLTASTSEAYAFLLQLLADPGDEVLVPSPSYPLFEHLARVEGVRVVPYRLAYDGAWHVDLGSVRAAVSGRARAILAVSPNNPTGSYLRRDEIDVLAELGLPIVSDEVFHSYRLSQSITRPPSILEARAPLAFALGGLSKLCALPQMKLAWIAVTGDKARVDQALERLGLIADTFLSVGTPVQEACAALLESRGAVHRAIVERLQENLDALRVQTAGSPATVLDVQGGWYATLQLPRTRSEEEWALAFLEEDGVYVHPGHFFDFEDEAYVVASLLTPAPVFTEGVGRLLERVRRGA